MVNCRGYGGWLRWVILIDVYFILMGDGLK